MLKKLRALKRCGPYVPPEEFSVSSSEARALVALKRAEYVEVAPEPAPVAPEPAPVAPEPAPVAPELPPLPEVSRGGRTRGRTERPKNEDN